MIERFNKLRKRHGVITLDYLLSTGLRILYSDQKYINEQRHYQFAETSESVVLPFVNYKTERPVDESKFDQEMVTEIKELAREHHLEIYEYGLSLLMETLLKLDQEITWESRSLEEVFDEPDPYDSYVDPHLDPNHYL